MTHLQLITLYTLQLIYSWIVYSLTLIDLFYLYDYYNTLSVQFDVINWFQEMNATLILPLMMQHPYGN